MSNLRFKGERQKAEGGQPDVERCAARNAFRLPPSSFRLRLPSPLSPPPSPLRTGITLIEVLISMGILTVGVLGVALMFPVGSFYAGRGDQYDRADAAATAAFNDAVTKGALNPQRWISYEPGQPETAAANSLWTNNYPYVGSAPGAFSRPFARDFAQRLALVNSNSVMSDRDKQKELTREVGSLFFIDPVSVASGVNTNDLSCNQQLRTVPASTLDITGWMRPDGAAWYPWYGSRAITRLSLAPTSNAMETKQPVSLAMAKHSFSVNDDLAVDQGENGDEPAQQLHTSFAPSGTSMPLNRQSNGNYRYLISVVPQSVEARDALAFGGRGLAYDVSAVVFNRRPQNRFDASDSTYGGIETTMRSERYAIASVQSKGPNGGEIKLRQEFGQYDQFLDQEVPWKNLKSGRYVMVVGPDPASTSTRPLLFAKWYRVLAISGDDASPEVALRGPEWPWDASGLANAVNSPMLSDNLRVLILDSAVAVHTRTKRLDAGVAWD